MSDTPPYGQPNAAELMSASAAFLRDVAAPGLQGRAAFLAKVAANALDIAERESRLGPKAAADERDALASLLGEEGDLRTLRETMCERLRAGALTVATPGLLETLEQIAAARVAIEQPRYASLSLAVLSDAPSGP